MIKRIGLVGRGQWDERRQGTDPRRTSLSEKWEEADKPTKEKKRVREVRGDPRGGSQEAGTGKEVPVLLQGAKELDYTGPLHLAVGRSLCLYQPCLWEWQSRDGGR